MIIRRETTGKWHVITGSYWYLLVLNKSQEISSLKSDNGKQKL